MIPCEELSWKIINHYYQLISANGNMYLQKKKEKKKKSKR